MFSKRHSGKPGDARVGFARRRQSRSAFDARSSERRQLRAFVVKHSPVGNFSLLTHRSRSDLAARRRRGARRIWTGETAMCSGSPPPRLSPRLLVLGCRLGDRRERAHVRGQPRGDNAAGTGRARPAPRPARPAVTPAEEAYVRAMWPIHGDVERSLMRASLGQILYKTNELSRAELQGTDGAGPGRPTGRRHAHARARAAGVIARTTTSSTSPRSVSSRSQRWRRRRCSRTGKEDHLLAAYPKSQEGSDKIREVGGKFWPNEFPPN